VIAPDELLAKAKRLYPSVVSDWIRDECKSFFPKRIPANLELKSSGTERKKQSELLREVQELRNHSKQTRGYGYSVHWEEIANRSHGLNEFPKQIWIDTLEDYLGWTRLKSDFERITSRIRVLREEFPTLESWVASSWNKLQDLDDDFQDLVTVTRYLRDHPRPDCFPRELPLAVPTKLVERQQKILGEWLDFVLASESIDFGCDRKDFAARYGFKSFRKHLLLRFLDSDWCASLGLHFEELSLPPSSIDALNVNDCRVIIVENKTNLLTLPTIPRTLGIFGEGKGVSQLLRIGWLDRSEIYYWGDLDVEGFEIYAHLKFRFPQTKSILMDLTTIQRFENLGTVGNGSEREVPVELNSAETEAFRYLRKNNLRIEQEHILQSYVNEAFRAILPSMDDSVRRVP
jgi:hypothetical protein